ncbi:MAG: ribonuclease III domain-containing protein [Firmicutes bacterium]|nr:ribonuclease III domain-containing protein [Bacillota bacterium]
MPELPEILMLAYLGDAVIELYVREHLISSGLLSPAECNEKALDFVTATRQSEALKNILPLLTEEEEGIFRRGKNAKPHSLPRNVKSYIYHLATGFEALFGYNHYLGRDSRNLELFRIAYGIRG